MSRSWRKPPRSCARRWATVESSPYDRATSTIKARTTPFAPLREARTASARLAPLLHAVPPGADARHEIVIAVDDLHRLALAVLGRLDAEAARLLLLLG